MLADDKNSEDVQTLVELGLTYRQSKIYLALTLLGKATINVLSSTVKMDRANVYRSMKQLRELKLVEMSLINPTTFKALPIDDAVRLLLENKKNKYKDAESKAKKFLRKRKHYCITNPNMEADRFVFVPGGGLTLKKLEELTGSTKETHDGILYLKDLIERADFFSGLFTKFLHNNIKIRIIFSSDNGEKLPPFFESLIDNNFVVRITETKPEATFSIWDKKRVFLTITPKISSPMTDGLFIENKAIVGLIQDYFELKWMHSKSILV